MNDIDEFATSLLEEAKRFLELAEETGSQIGTIAYLHAALMLGFSSLEAHINAIAADFVGSQSLSVHEQGLLQEKEVKLSHGDFELTSALKMSRLEDRIEFLHFKFTGNPVDRNTPWWNDFKAAAKLRNELTHPRGTPSITVQSVGRALQAILDTLNAVYKAVYRRKFPKVGRGLRSTLSF